MGRTLLLGQFVLLLAACSAERHYTTLSFFLDGVPRPGEELEQEMSLSPQYRRPEGREPSKFNMLRHAPYQKNECDRCHPRQEAFWIGENFDKRGQCFSCHEHEEFAKRLEDSPFVHGPVAVRECLVCHNAHQSIHPGLLELPAPKLCYLCHERDAMVSSPAHRDWSEEEEACLSCHDPHAGSDPYFLRDGAPEAGSSDESETGESREDSEKAAELRGKTEDEAVDSGGRELR